MDKEQHLYEIYKKQTKELGILPIDFEFWKKLKGPKRSICSDENCAFCKKD